MTIFRAWRSPLGQGGHRGRHLVEGAAAFDEAGQLAVQAAEHRHRVGEGTPVEAVGAHQRPLVADHVLDRQRHLVGQVADHQHGAALRHHAHRAYEGARAADRVHHHVRRLAERLGHRRTGVLHRVAVRDRHRRRAELRRAPRLGGDGVQGRRSALRRGARATSTPAMPMVPAPRMATRRGATLRALQPVPAVQYHPQRLGQQGRRSRSARRRRAGSGWRRVPATYSAIAPRLPRLTPINCLLRNDGSPSSGLGRVIGDDVVQRHPGARRRVARARSEPLHGARSPRAPSPCRARAARSRRLKPCTSLPQMPTVSTRRSASPAPGSGAGRSTTLMSQGPLY